MKINTQAKLMQTLLQFVLMMSLSYLPHAWAGVAGIVEQAKGKVYLTAPTKKDLSIGTVIAEGDELVSEAESEALLKLEDGTIVAVRPNTRMVFTQYSFNADEKQSQNDGFLVSLFKGGLRTITGKIGKRHPEKFKVQTPTATIGIRGTDFEVAVVEKDNTQAQAGTYNKVFTGQTFLDNNQGKRVDVSANQAAFAPTDALKMAQQFGLLKQVPNVFFNGSYDSLLQGLQDEAIKQLESRMGVQLPTEVKKLIPSLKDFLN